MVSIGRVYPLKPIHGWTELTNMHDAGTFYAYVIGHDDFDTQFQIRSIDLRTGRHAHTVGFSPGKGGVADLTLKPNGSIAWIQVDHVDLANSEKLDATLILADTRSVRLPRHGRHVRQGSLRLRGSTLSWKQGRRRFSTRLN
jgi:hypothetical protein